MRTLYPTTSGQATSSANGRLAAATTLSSKRSTLGLNGSDAIGNLSCALALDWVNGKCGPTSIYHMLEFRGLLMLYPTRTPTQHINHIATYTGDGVDLISLQSGTNAYLIAAANSLSCIIFADELARYSI